MLSWIKFIQSKFQAFLLFMYFLNLLIYIAYTQLASWNKFSTLLEWYLRLRPLNSNSHLAHMLRSLVSNFSQLPWINWPKWGKPIWLWKRNSKNWLLSPRKTEQAITTWLDCWESHFELHPKPHAVKIGYIGRELGGQVATWWRGLRTPKNLTITWEGFIDVFKK